MANGGILWDMNSSIATILANQANMLVTEVHLDEDITVLGIVNGHFELPLEEKTNVKHGN